MERKLESKGKKTRGRAKLFGPGGKPKTETSDMNIIGPRRSVPQHQTRAALRGEPESRDGSAGEEQVLVLRDEEVSCQMTPEALEENPTQAASVTNVRHEKSQM